MSQEKSINLYAAAERIKQAVNKEQEIENVLNEIDEKLSLTKSEKIQVIEWLEKYFREDEKKSLDENFSRGKEFPCRGRFEYGLPPLQATDNTDILDALEDEKKKY